MKGKKIIIVVLALLVSMVVTISTYKNLEGTKVEEIEERQKNLFAIKVDNGNGNYEDSTGFPGTGYSLNIPLTKCEDQMGNKVSNVKITGNGTNVTVTSKYTVYCTLYFDKGTSLSQFCNGVDLKTCIGNKKDYIGDVANMTTSLVGGMYRYQGIDNVNNWICFGTTSNCGTDDTNIDKYMYRIIGVTSDGQLALIKETGVKEIESTNRGFYWDNKYTTTDCGTNGEKCTWPNSMIFKRLNGKSNGNVTGTSGNTNIFIGNSYYEYLNSGSTWESKINNRTWKYGDSNELNSYNGDSAYSIESQFPNSIEAKIGLQYVHDYYYAYPEGNPGSGTNAKNAWIHLRKNGNSEISYEWLISKYGVGSTNVSAWDVYSSGTVYNSRLDNSFGVRPVFYLKSDIKIKDGTGEKTNPYILVV